MRPRSLMEMTRGDHCGTLGLSAAMKGTASAAAMAKRTQVRVTSPPLLAKPGLYSFSVRAGDEVGNLVRDVRVALPLLLVQRSAYRLVAARHTGDGQFHGLSNLHWGAENPRRGRAEVERPANRAGETTRTQSDNTMQGG